MSKSEERLQVCDFDPLTKKEFVELMHSAASMLEEHIALNYEGISKNANKLRELARRVHYSGKAYREEPKDYYSEHAKPIAIWKNSNIPKIDREVIEECFVSICNLAGPTTDEIDGLLISKRWYKIPDSDSKLAALVEKRDSYIFLIDLIAPLLEALYEIEIKGVKMLNES